MVNPPAVVWLSDTIIAHVTLSPCYINKAAALTRESSRRRETSPIESIITSLIPAAEEKGTKARALEIDDSLLARPPDRDWCGE
jgi:hypothetical protein